MRSGPTTVLDGLRKEIEVTLTRKNPMGLNYQLHAENDKTIAVLQSLKSVKTVVLDMTLDEVNQAWFHWMQGKNIQDAFKNLPAEQREFLLTGITPAEWKKLFQEGKEG